MGRVKFLFPGWLVGNSHIAYSKLNKYFSENRNQDAH